jgi:hypothetical protein
MGMRELQIINAASDVSCKNCGLDKGRMPRSDNLRGARRLASWRHRFVAHCHRENNHQVLRNRLIQPEPRSLATLRQFTGMSDSVEC